MKKLTLRERIEVQERQLYETDHVVGTMLFALGRLYKRLDVLEAERIKVKPHKQAKEDK